MKMIEYNIDFSNRPETYKTILGKEYGRNTETTKLRRKLSNAVRSGFICNRKIDVIGKGLDRIFFNIEKEYFIVYTNKSCYYCSNISTKKDKLELIKSYELNCVKWIERGNLLIDVSEVKLCF